MSDARAIASARAIDALRRGWPIVLDSLTLLPVETADDGRLAAFDPEAIAPMLISSGRAATLNLANQRDAAAPDCPVLIERTPWLDFDAATALADPQHDLQTPLKGPFHTLPLAAPDTARGALRLARIAGLLPAFFVGGTGALAALTSIDIDAHETPDRLRLVSRARLPVVGAEHAQIVGFRAADGSNEPVALVIGEPTGAAPLVRLHSECLTGDVLGSLKCDCGPQLHAAIAAIAASGWGILLYLRQEGRGIGLINKLRAYAMQDQGYDTVDANMRLGFPIDSRNFGVAAQMLGLLGQNRVRLLTNNPAKVVGLEAHEIAVSERIPHKLPPNPHNVQYLATKRDRTGHKL